MHSSCFDSLVREFGAICQDLGYKHSLFGCLYSYPSVVSGILPNHNEGTNQRGFSEKEAFPFLSFFFFFSPEFDHLPGVQRYSGFIETTYKVTLNSYFTEMSD